MSQVVDLLQFHLVPELTKLVVEFRQGPIWVSLGMGWWIGQIGWDEQVRVLGATGCKPDSVSSFCNECDLAAFNPSRAIVVHEFERYIEYDLTPNWYYMSARTRRPMTSADPLKAHLYESLAGIRDDVKWCAGRNLPSCVHYVRSST